MNASDTKQRYYIPKKAAKVIFPDLSNEQAYQELMANVDSGRIALSVQLYNQYLSNKAQFLSEGEPTFFQATGVFRIVLDDSPENETLRRWIRIQANGSSSPIKLVPVHMVLFNGVEHILITKDRDDAPNIGEATIPIENLLIQEQDIETFQQDLPRLEAADAMPTITTSFPSVEPADCYLRIEDVLDLLKVSENTFRKHIENGRFPQPERMGRSVRWRKSEILAAIKDPSHKQH